MKKILWTTVFWLVVFFGFALYIKMFDANLATNVSTFLGITTLTTSGEPITTSGDLVVAPVAPVDFASEIVTIKTALTDIQTKVDMLVGPTPVADPTPVVTPDIMTGN